jgi:hypothetical protein
VQFGDQIGKRGGPNGSIIVLDQIIHDLRRPIVHDALMAVLDQPPHHVRTHPAQANHAQLHCDFIVHARNQNLSAISNDMPNRGLA